MPKKIYYITLTLLVCVKFVFAQKPIISKIEDLPVFTYNIPAKPSEFVQQKNSFESFAAKVTADAQALLETNDIQDKTTLKQIYRILLAKAVLDADADKILEISDQIRANEEKPADKLLSGLIYRVLAQTWKDEKTYTYGRTQDAFRINLTNAINILPFDTVQNQIEQLKGSFEILSRNVLIGLTKSQLDPSYEKTGNISGDAAQMLLRVRRDLIRVLEFRKDIIDIFDRYIKENKVEKADIWATRSVAFNGTENYKPVILAIWDSGIDATVYGDQMWLNKNEIQDGQDTDNNGFVDDIHGIAFDVHEYYSPRILYPLSREQLEKLPRMRDQMKGLQDLRAAVDSDEARALRQQLAAMPPEKMNKFLEELMIFMIYMHGTYVTGIALDGNPYAKILAARVTFDPHTVPEPPSPEQAERAAENYMQTVNYFKSQGVRAVNMSWGWTFSEIEGMLEANGIGKDAAERREKTKTIFNIYREGLYKAVKSAPGILFVTAAGNENSDVEFDQVIPSSFDLPNLLVVGAVDQAGEETSFTSFGEQVTLHANGFEIESYIPGGDRMKASGTSAASPNVLNLIGKMLAANPKLSPHDLISLIRKDVEKSADGRIFLINPKKTLERLMTDNN